jgi:hypothetical protein
MTLLTFLALLNILQAQGATVPNVMVVGPSRATDAALRRLAPEFRGPATDCRLPGKLSLSNRSAGVLILRDVGALNRTQQAELLAWMDSPSRIPVVAVHPSPPFDLVMDGTFSEELYYRLNTVLLDDSALTL